MTNLELPLKKRTKFYRFFEILPGLLSYGSVILLIVLSVVAPLLAALFLLLVITTMLVKAIGIAVHTIGGRNRLARAEKLSWNELLSHLEDPSGSLTVSSLPKNTLLHHKENLERISANPDIFPKPSEVYNLVIVATYNEPYEVLNSTLKSLESCSYDSSRLLVFLAYEERGGPATAETAMRLEKEYKSVFGAFVPVMHPKDLPGEVVGKGANITFAGQKAAEWLSKKKIEHKNVIVTTLDSDNRPHEKYFDYLTYEFIVNPRRKHQAYQPISLFLNNIWDVPAAMRVVATGNSFWNIISSMRPHTLRNFASHSQPMDALVEMDFWSKRSIVEDGHQYWRSYFHFDGDYEVVPLFIPIYQDAVMSDTYKKTLVAQFVQLRRWAYGASDVPYVAERVLTKKRTVPFWAGFTRFVRLLDGHVTLASIPPLITFGGWVPLLINTEAIRSVSAHQLPEVLGLVHRIALIGLLISIFLSFKLLPKRPQRYRRRRTIWMVLQWFLMPVTALLYTSLSAFYSQTRLMFGKYMDKFDVTEKATVAQKKMR